MRQVFYHFDDGDSWCASEPTLINQVKPLSKTEDKTKVNFKDSVSFIKNESAWIGNKTLYDDCYKLMPNHYLNLTISNQIRFFPKTSLSASKCTDKLVTKAALFLKNIMEGLEHKFNINISLTAGFDSRLLLAASKNISDKVIYSTDKLGKWKSYHADIYIPRKLKQRFDLNHKVINSNQEPPEWFIKILSENISKARTYPSLGKARSMYSELANRNSNRILINGNATEIVRISDQKLEYISDREGYKSRDSNLLIEYSGYRNKYVNDEIEKWINSINESVISEATILDLFYWEQRMGNWGALFPAELDIATETISPFNCRGYWKCV